MYLWRSMVVGLLLLAAVLPAAAQSKIVNVETGEVTAPPTMDPGLGRRVRPVDGEKIHPLLSERLEARPTARHRIGIWLRAADVDARLRMTARLAAGDSVEEARTAMRAELAALNGGVIEAARGELGSMGLEVTYGDLYAPVVFTEATADQIDELARLGSVVAIYPSLEYEAELADQVGTHRWNRVHDFGIRGDGVKVAIVENGGVSDTHPDLNVTAWYNDSNRNVNFHPTAIAGIIGSSDTTYPGHARGIEILSGNANSWTDMDLMGAATWAVNQGCDVVSMSFGSDTNLLIVALDRYVDYMVRNTATTFTKSAGNRGSSDGDCTSPGLGWNIITVGNVQDQDNPDWDDDVMRFDTSFGDPISPVGDREKPELSAVGTNIFTTDLSDGFSGQGSGTSYAAPAVAGMAAALMQADTSLKAWPEPVKAIFMAAATHNVEGASRISDVDGAGAINGLQAYRMVEKESYRFGAFFPSSFSNNGYFTHDVWLRGGDTTRVVLTWDSLASSDYMTDTLEADLDLAVFPGQGVTGGAGGVFSSSWDNSFEIVEFCPPTTGWYTIRVNDFRFDGNSEFYGLAWTQHHDGRYTRFRPWLPDNTFSDLTGPVIGNQFFWLDPIDEVNGGDAFIFFASFLTNFGFNVGACRRNLGDLDDLSTFSVMAGNGMFEGYTGTFGTAGTWFSGRINVPDVGGLAGFPIYMNLVTLDPLAPSGVKEVGVVEKIVFQDHATDLSLGTDGTGQVDIGFAFPFYGTSYTQLYVNANGNVTFGSGDTDFTESVTDFLAGAPRIAPFWDDFNSNIGGLVRTRKAGSQFVVEWVDVAEYATSTANTNSVMLILHDDGVIEMKYRDCDLLDGLVGISPGGGATGTEFDLDHGFRSVFGGAIYEDFNDPAKTFDLGVSSSYRNTVRFTPDGGGYRLTVDLQ